MAEKRAQLVTLGILEQGLTRLKREYLGRHRGGRVRQLPQGGDCTGRR